MSRHKKDVLPDIRSAKFSEIMKRSKNHTRIYMALLIIQYLSIFMKTGIISVKNFPAEILSNFLIYIEY